MNASLESAMNNRQCVYNLLRPSNDVQNGQGIVCDCWITPRVLKKIGLKGLPAAFRHKHCLNSSVDVSEDSAKEFNDMLMT